MKFLARQGIPFHGDGNESDGNFMQLPHLRVLDDSKITDMLQKKTNKYTSPQIQNELIQLMSIKVLREIAAFIHQASYFA